MKKTIIILKEGTPIEVNKADYIRLKTRVLIDFGYNTLTEREVEQSVNRVINKEKLTTVIDHFVEGDIVIK